MVGHIDFLQPLRTGAAMYLIVCCYGIIEKYFPDNELLMDFSILGFRKGVERGKI